MDKSPRPERIPRYRLCPKCARAVPTHSRERYCINDGTWLLEACPVCTAPITSPYARFCGSCGLEFGTLTQPRFERDLEPRRNA